MSIFRDALAALLLIVIGFAVIAYAINAFATQTMTLNPNALEALPWL